MVHTSPTAALTAAAALLLPLATACGDETPERAPDATTTVVTTPPTVSPTSSPTGATTGAPADPAAAREEIEANWELLFDAKATTDEKVRVLEDGEDLRATVAAFSRTANAARISAEVTEVDFTSPTRADVTYDLKLGTATPLGGAKGVAVLEGGTWKVARESLCALMRLNPDAGSVPGC